MKFTTTLLGAGTNKVGIEVPPEVVEAFGAGKRPAITVTINGYTYRSTVAVMGGKFLVGVNGENRAAAKVAGGDTVEVEIALDTAPRIAEPPADFAAALDANPAARAFFGGLSLSQQKWFIAGIESAKKPETRAKRIVDAVARLASGRGQA